MIWELLVPRGRVLTFYGLWLPGARFVWALITTHPPPVITRICRESRDVAEKALVQSTFDCKDPLEFLPQVERAAKVLVWWNPPGDTILFKQTHEFPGLVASPGAGTKACWAALHGSDLALGRNLALAIRPWAWLVNQHSYPLRPGVQEERSATNVVRHFIRGALKIEPSTSPSSSASPANSSSIDAGTVVGPEDGARAPETNVRTITVAIGGSRYRKFRLESEEYEFGWENVALDFSDNLVDNKEDPPSPDMEMDAAKVLRAVKEIEEAIQQNQGQARLVDPPLKIEAKWIITKPLDVS